jgi:hypothetical protein
MVASALTVMSGSKSPIIGTSVCVTCVTVTVTAAFDEVLRTDSGLRVTA